MTSARDVVRRRIDRQGTQGDHRHQPGRRPDPRRGAGRRGSRGAEEFDRPDRQARVQAGRPHRRSEPGCTGTCTRGQPGAADGRGRRLHRGEAPRDGRRRSAGRCQASFDQDGRPVVSITFNTAGARRFGRVTQENVNKPFAIILDDKVLSAPNINEPILGGRRRSAAISPSRAPTSSPISLALGQAAGEAERHRGADGRSRARARIRSARASSPASSRRSP